jgi:hypothetical protein
MIIISMIWIQAFLVMRTTSIAIFYFLSTRKIKDGEEEAIGESRLREA